MPQLLIAAVVGAGLWAGYKLLRREMARVESDLRRAEARLRRGREEVPRVTLELDPRTGVYKPKGS